MGELKSNIEQCLKLVEPTADESFESEMQIAFQNIYEFIGFKQVSILRTEFAPPRVTQQAEDKELAENWKDVNEIVSEDTLKKMLLQSGLILFIKLNVRKMVENGWKYAHVHTVIVILNGPTFAVTYQTFYLSPSSSY